MTRAPLIAGCLLALTACTAPPAGNPILADPALRSGWTAARACNVYAAGVREATRRANAGDWTPEQDRVVDTVVQTYGPLCSPVVQPDAWRIGETLVDTFARVGIVIAEDNP